MKGFLSLLILAAFAIYYTDSYKDDMQYKKLDAYCRKHSKGLLKTDKQKFILFFAKFREEKCNGRKIDLKKLKKKKDTTVLMEEIWMDTLYCGGPNSKITKMDKDCIEFYCRKAEKKSC